MKKEVCLMCIVCFFLGYFIADVVSKCGFGAEHLTKQSDKKKSVSSKNPLDIKTAGVATAAAAAAASAAASASKAPCMKGGPGGCRRPGDSTAPGSCSGMA